MSTIRSIFNDQDSKIARIRQLREIVPGLGLSEAKRIADDEYARQFPPPVGQTFKVVTTDHGNIALILSVEALRNGMTWESAKKGIFAHADSHMPELRAYEDGEIESEAIQADANIIS